MGGWAGIVAVAALGACGFQAQNPGAVDTPTADARGIDGPPLDGLVPVDSAIDAPPDAPPPPECIDRTISASKSYPPIVVNEPGELAAEAPYVLLVLPPVLRIQYGNAGNHCAELRVTRADNSLVRCRYQGGADVSNTGLDPVQIAKGLRYELDRCTLGAACPTSNGTPVTVAAGDQVELSDTSTVYVRIDNGDSSKGPTVIREGIRRCRETD